MAIRRPYSVLRRRLDEAIEAWEREIGGYTCNMPRVAEMYHELKMFRELRDELDADS